MRMGCADEAQQFPGAYVNSDRRAPVSCEVAVSGTSQTDACAHAVCMRACPKHNGRSLGALGTGLGPLTHPSTHTGDPRPCGVQ